MRNWMTTSDERLSPQAAVLSPDSTMKIATAIIGASSPYHQTIAAGRAAVQILSDGIAQERLRLSRKEQQWLTRIDEALDSLPENENVLMHDLEVQYGNLYDKASYEL